MKSQAGTIALVGVAVLVAIVFGHFLGADRGSGVTSVTVAAGVIEGAVVCAAWVAARNRKASGAGLIVCAVLLLASAASVSPFVAFGRMSITWALVTALAARFLFSGETAEQKAAEQPLPVAVGNGPR